MNEQINFDVEDFSRVYRGKTQFLESEYFKTFLQSLDDVELYSHLKFCNDVLQIPPIKAFVRYRRMVDGDNSLFCHKIEDDATKRNLGACFGYLFKNIFGYSQSKSVRTGDATTGIVTCSYFIK